MEVVHNGVVPKTPSVLSDPISVGLHLITFLGRVTYQKGPQYFVEAARKVLERFPEAHFIMAGSGDLLPQMIERVAQLKMSLTFILQAF